MAMNESNSHTILSGKRLVESMRYGGYRNPAYALAEIIDNSVEAGAKSIEILCSDETNYSTNRQVLNEICIIDDGVGMSKEELWNSLVFGEGTRNNTGKIGRFGMGLPNSSISQCKRVTVYTWKKPNEVYATFLDLDEIKKNKQQNIPEPVKMEIPELCKKESKLIQSKSGTIVIWSKLDRCSWKKSKTIIANSEKQIGRIYRKFIHNNKLKIRMAAFSNAGKSIEMMMLPNDPLYQMVPSSTPEPWNKIPMFEKDGNKWEEIIQVDDENGNKHNVKMRFTFAKKDAREVRNAGSLKHGKHASANQGVSVIRADRELNLDTNLLITYDPRERWWGAEIEFPPALDEFFGITNTKQEATIFSAMTKIAGSIARDEGSDASEDIDDDNYNIKKMNEIIARLLKRIRPIRARIKEQSSKPGGKEAPNEKDPVNDAKQRRYTEGNIGKTDVDKQKKSNSQLKQELTDTLSDVYPSKKEAAEAADKLVKMDSNVQFVTTDLRGSQFFDVCLDGGVEIIKLNRNHNAYKNLMTIVEDVTDDMDCDEIKKHLNRARIGLKLLLGSWACYEDEEKNQTKRKIIADIRYEWGKILDDYLDR